MNLRMKWRFNLDRALGGVVCCLKKVLKDAKLWYEELLTVVTEIEFVLNTCRAMYVSSEDTEEPLASSHLMTEKIAVHS